tara:strand:- start:15 stop:401 length:387 start_codon:yes stop_codon:yes gene_type:complete
MVKANKSMLPGAAGSVRNQKLTAKFKAIALNTATTQFNNVYNTLSLADKSSMEKKGMNKMALQEAYLTQEGVLGHKQFIRGYVGKDNFISFNSNAKEMDKAFLKNRNEKLINSIKKNIKSFFKGFKKE